MFKYRSNFKIRVHVSLVWISKSELYAYCFFFLSHLCFSYLFPNYLCCFHMDAFGSVKWNFKTTIIWEGCSLYSLNIILKDRSNETLCWSYLFILLRRLVWFVPGHSKKACCARLNPWRNHIILLEHYLLGSSNVICV